MSMFFSAFAIPIVAIIGVFVWMSISAIAEAAQSIVKHRNEIELKQMMVDRGMSAEEIERVVRATNQSDE